MVLHFGLELLDILETILRQFGHSLNHLFIRKYKFVVFLIVSRTLLFSSIIEPIEVGLAALGDASFDGFQ